MLSKCLCNRFLNPEETMVICDQCDKSYCALCPKNKFNNLKAFFCDFCKSEIPENVINEKFQLSKSKVQQNKAKEITYHEIIDEDEDEYSMKIRTPTIDLEKL